MQFELILGFLLLTQLTTIYNYIVLLYAKYRELYDDIKNMLSAVQTDEVAVHDGIFNIECQSPTGYTYLIGVRSGVAYWTSAASSYATISDGSSTWSIAIANWDVKSIALTSGGWMVMYDGTSATVEAGKKRFKLYDLSFTATATDLTLDGVAINRSCKSLIGYDGTSVYCTGSGDYSEYIASSSTDSNDLVYYAVAVVNMTTGALTYEDNKMGLIWGADFYPIDDTFVYASKPIYTPFIYGCARNKFVYRTGSVQYGFGVNQFVLSGNSASDYVLMFDGTYVYRIFQSKSLLSGTKHVVSLLQKQIL